MTQASILIVEDDRVVARDIELRLGRLGYGVAGTARFGEDAVRLAGELRPDLILMDIRLAGDLDGVAAAERIREEAQVPVVYLTAYADEDTLARARVTEPFGYLHKPFDERDLHTAVEMALYKHQAERRLRESEERYRSIFDNAIEGIFQLTVDGRLVTVNPALARMLGHESPEDLVSSVDGAAHRLHADPDRHAEHLRRCEEHGLVQGFECPLLCKDGHKAWVSMSTRAVKDGRGATLFYEGCVEEITERKRLEEQFRQAQKLEAVGRLAGGVAHDFNNLLMVINSCATMLAREIDGGGRAAEVLGEIQKAGQRAAGLTRQLLVFSRKQPHQPRVTDLNELVQDLAQMLRWVLGEQIELVVRLEDGLGLIEVEPVQLEQVLMNLAVNARDAMPRGGTLTVETRGVELTEAHARLRPGAPPGLYAEISFTDTGHGMDEATKARIFEPFFTTKPLDQGTGLGLALAHGVVRQSGGHIDVTSEVDGGATFTIRLPVVEPAARRGPVDGAFEPA